MLTQDDKTKPDGAPEKYEAFKVPDGYELTEGVAKEAGDLFKSMNLSQAQAQSLMDFYAAKTQALTDAPYELYAETRKGWLDTVKADPALASNGVIKAEVKANVAALYTAIGNEALVTQFKEAMDMTGVGDHPAFIKAMNILGAMHREGRAVTGNGPAPVRAPGSQPKSAAQALYPNLA